MDVVVVVVVVVGVGVRGGGLDGVGVVVGDDGGIDRGSVGVGLDGLDLVIEGSRLVRKRVVTSVGVRLVVDS